MAWLVALVLALLTKRAPAHTRAVSVLRVQAPAPPPPPPPAGRGLVAELYRPAQTPPQAPARTVPDAWSLNFGVHHPPWVASIESLLGLAPGERAPPLPPWPRVVAHSANARSATQRRHSNGGTAASVAAAIGAGELFLPMSGDGKTWSSWQGHAIQASSDLCAQWRRAVLAYGSPATGPLAVELDYATCAYHAMAEVLRVARTDHAAPDRVLEAANAYVAYSVAWLQDHAEEILETSVALAAMGASSTVVASVATAGVTASLAAVGSVAAFALPVAAIGLAVYAFVTGARPGDTTGKGNDVAAFPRGGTEGAIKWLRAIDVEAYMQSMARAVTLELHRRGAYAGGVIGRAA